jgi:Uma2 family endonuclease
MAVPVPTKTKVWTLEELHSLPDDGNKYELVRGALFVTPPPTVDHEEVAARLDRILAPFVAASGLGYVYRPRAVIQARGSEVEPDLMVRLPHPNPKAGWDAWPVPLLVVEIISPGTRRRDREQKKAFYLEAGVAEYWIVDPERRNLTIVRPGKDDWVEDERVDWAPRGTGAVLILSLDEVFGATRKPNEGETL